jgi:hypothetical protein
MGLVPGFESPQQFTLTVLMKRLAAMLYTLMSLSTPSAAFAAGADPMDANVGKSIIVAIVWPKVKNEQATIDAYSGKVERTANGYAITKGKNKPISLTPAWSAKIISMTKDLKQTFGNADLMLVVQKAEFAAAGYDYDVSSTGDMVFKVTK